MNAALGGWTEEDDIARHGIRQVRPHSHQRHPLADGPTPLQQPINAQQNMQDGAPLNRKRSRGWWVKCFLFIR